MLGQIVHKAVTIFTSTYHIWHPGQLPPPPQKKEKNTCTNILSIDLISFIYFLLIDENYYRYSLQDFFNIDYSMSVWRFDYIILSFVEEILQI